MLTFHFTGKHGEMTVSEKLTAGAIGKHIRIIFSPEWDGLEKSAVFMALDGNSGTTCAVDANDEVLVIPAEVLLHTNHRLYLQIQGFTADGTAVINSDRIPGPRIEPGVDPEELPELDAQNPVWYEVLSQMGDLAELETGSNNSLVSAINELALRKPADGASAYEIALENGFEGSEAQWLESLAGKNAYEYAQDAGYTGTEEEFTAALLGNKDILIVDLTSEDGVLSANKNYYEIAHACAADKLVLLRYGTFITHILAGEPMEGSFLFEPLLHSVPGMPGYVVNINDYWDAAPITEDSTKEVFDNFIVTLEQDESGEYSASASYMEIAEAREAGKLVLMQYGVYVTHILAGEPTESSFLFEPLLHSVPGMSGYTVDINDNWSPVPAADTESESDIFIGTMKTPVSDFLHEFYKGKACFLRNPYDELVDNLWILSSASLEVAHFYTVTYKGVMRTLNLYYDGSWNATDLNLPDALSDKVDVGHLVTAIGKDSADYQIPTAKAVYDALEGKLDATELSTAVNNALEQAKASGDFKGEDGEDGGYYIPTATQEEDELGNPTLVIAYNRSESSMPVLPPVGISLPVGPQGETGATGATGAAGADGKTAYEYAQDGGYTGTEAEFSAKLAKEYDPNPLYGKKVSFLGDSICVGSDENSNYGKIIADRNSMVYENAGHAGATVTAETYSRTTGNAKPWLCRMVENMSADADYAIIEGGINDGWDETVKANIGAITQGYNAELDDTTYYGAFESMLKQLVTKFQGKKIGYIAVPKIHSLFDSSQNVPNFYHIALECCAKWGVSVCDLNTITPPVEYLADLGTDYTADACHPTYEGYLKYYCDPIESWMKTLTTGASVIVGAVSSDLDDRYVTKNDISIKKAQLTLEDGTTVLIDVVVGSAGTTIQKYFNHIPTSIDTDGSIYNGVGYKNNTRLSSTGIEKTTGGAIATGFISAVGGDVIRLGGDAPWYKSGLTDNYLCAYDADFNYIGGVYSTANAGNHYYTAQIAVSSAIGDVCEITLASGLGIAYIRANWPSSTAADGTTGADLIVTVNEGITL